MTPKELAELIPRKYGCIHSTEELEADLVALVAAGQTPVRRFAEKLVLHWGCIRDRECLELELNELVDSEIRRRLL